ERRAEVPDPSALPAWRLGPKPGGIGRAIAPGIDGGRRALEDVEVLRPGAEVRDDLDRRRPGPDHADALVAQPREAARLVAAGVGVVPAAGVEELSREGLDAGDVRELGAAQG